MGGAGCVDAAACWSHCATSTTAYRLQPAPPSYSAHAIQRLIQQKLDVIRNTASPPCDRLRRPSCCGIHPYTSVQCHTAGCTHTAIQRIQYTSPYTLPLPSHCTWALRYAGIPKPNRTTNCPSTGNPLGTERIPSARLYVPSESPRRLCAGSAGTMSQ